jgi:hypothetical protein
MAVGVATATGLMDAPSQQVQKLDVRAHRVGCDADERKVYSHSLAEYALT